MKTTKIETNSYQGVYQLPLKYDGYNYVWSKKNIMTLMFGRLVPEEDRVKVVKSLNKESELKIEGLTNNKDEFFINGEYAFCVRGWGHLTGIGAMNLPLEKAIEIQDGFINYILERLKK
jgi:hypothetical protein